MGITGLLPFLEKSSKKTNISEFSGGTAAIDTYCWLHRGAFSCADKLSMGQHTDAYVKYCMKFVRMLLAAKIKPILVFDGRHLPAKAETEEKRREARRNNRKRAAELMKMGNTAEGRNLLKRALDVTHKMALELIKACQEINVDCIVAPYEADAQLAYLSIMNIANVVITEDSDLLSFGCKKVLFKMDMNGNGVLIDQQRLHLAMGLRQENFNLDKFQHMCILSGCDYLPSLPGIGLNKACKFIIKIFDCDVQRALPRMSSYLNMKSLPVTKEYIEAFTRAFITFKHQLVYCPLKRKQVRLHEPASDVTEEQLKFAGDEMDDEKIAWQLALGNCDPFTLEKMHDFDPDKVQRQRSRTNSWSELTIAKHVSIWSKDFRIKVRTEDDRNVITLPNTVGKMVVLKSTEHLKKVVKLPRKRSYDECQEMPANDFKNLLKMYTRNNNEEVASKSSPSKTAVSKSETERAVTPVSRRRINPFKKQANGESPSLLSEGKMRSVLRFKPTVIDESTVVQSKFFASKISEEEEKRETTEKEKSEDSKSEEKENRSKDSECASSLDVNYSYAEETVETERESLSLSVLGNRITNDCCLTEDDTSKDSVDFLDFHRENDNQGAQECNGADLETEFCASMEEINESSQNIYKFGDSKLSGNNSQSSQDKKSQRGRPSLTRQQSFRKRTQGSKKAELIQGQSLLNRFGFQTRTVLKR